MKKILSICSILTIFTFSCGFVKTDTIINIDKNKNVSIEKTVLMTDEFGEDTIRQFTDVEKVKRDGLKVEVKKENGYSGLDGKKEYKLDNISSDNVNKIEIDKFLNSDFDDKNLIKVEKGFFKNKYTIDFTYNRDKVKAFELIFAISNPYDKDNKNNVLLEGAKYTKCLSMIEENKTNEANKNTKTKTKVNTKTNSKVTNEELLNCQTYVEGYEAYQKEMKAKVEKLSKEVEYNLTITLPTKAIESNETVKSNDGKKLTWTFVKEEPASVNCSFEILNMTNIYLVGGGSLVLAIIIILLIIMLNKKKKEKIENIETDKPIHTDYDPSIASEIDAMGGFIDRGSEVPIPDVDMVTNTVNSTATNTTNISNEEINKRSYEYTLPHEIPNVVKEKEPEKAPVFITSQNTKEDEIVIEEKPKEVKIITPEITDIK